MTDPAEIAAMLRLLQGRFGMSVQAVAEINALRGLLADAVERYGGHHSIECVTRRGSGGGRNCICGADDWLRRVEAAVKGESDGD